MTTVEPSQADHGPSLRIAMVTRYPPSGTTHAGRGIGPYTKQLAEAMGQSRARVVVFADREADRDTTYVEGAVTVRRVWREGLSAVRDVEGAIRRDGAYSIIHIQHELFAFGRGAGALAAGQLLRRIKKICPVVTTVHGVIPRSAFNRRFTGAYARAMHPRVVEMTYVLIMKQVIRNSDLVIVHSEEVLESLRGYGEVGRSLVVPHGISEPATRLGRRDGLQQLGLPDAKRAVFLGFRLPYKGIETLEAAIPDLSRSGIEVVIAGGESGDVHPTHTSRQRVHHSGALRLGFVPESLLPALFAITDVLVLPYSVGLSVSGPLCLAAAYDVPVVVSDVPTLAGALRCPEATFPVGNATALARAVRQVMHNDVVRTQVRGRLAAMKAAATWPAIAHEHISAYQRLLASSSDGMQQGHVGPSVDSFTQETTGPRR